VLAHNPELTDAEREALAQASEPDPATWRRLTLRMTKLDGSELRIELLRPLKWLKAAGVAVDADLADRTTHEAVSVDTTIELKLPELGASGPATLLTLGPCPPIEPGPGCVVTGTLEHQAAEVVTVTVSPPTGRATRSE